MRRQPVAERPPVCKHGEPLPPTVEHHCNHKCGTGPSQYMPYPFACLKPHLIFLQVSITVEAVYYTVLRSIFLSNRLVCPKSDGNYEYDDSHNKPYGDSTLLHCHS